MKLKFKIQDFQTDAVNAVVDLFAGQEKTHNTFSVIEGNQRALMNELGVGNALYIDEETLLENLHAVQKRNQLPLTQNAAEMQFCIEMETGTGKTYVYTKTIFELNRKYGFTKFIIVVPSVAIREGVNKSFEITREHFGLQYDNVPCRFFIYNSEKLSDVRQFATSANIEIMIINIDAFKKAENIINQPQDKLNGETAMRYIQDTHPIVVIDEPQSVDNTPKSKEAIASLNPLCVVKYSATHREKINLLYRLTPVDAYQMGLVKQISVSSNQVYGGFNKPFIRLLSVSGDKGFRAKIEIDVKNTTGTVSRKQITIKPGDDLFMLSGKRELYAGYVISGIDCTPDYERIEFANTEELELGKALGDVDENIVKRAQIRRTIETHLDKELRYIDKGIKVLSLFFIDKVDKYRHEDGSKGVYSTMFDECYTELINKPKYAILKERFNSNVSAAHNGYFSQDKKGQYKDTNGATQADDDTYNTIMRDKEWLLSFECPLRFIFSHSALKEGWDNPNVFQVCTLIEQKSTFTCRQKVGRGLRLCVNQDGERIEDKNINILHVMANESFAEFAETLQKEIEVETGVKFDSEHKLPISDASRNVVVKLKKQVIVSPEFLELWNKIKQKTAYRVEIDTKPLIDNCVKALIEMPSIPKTRLITQTADINIEISGISYTERETRFSNIENAYQALPDIMNILCDETLLTPSTIYEILVRSERCVDFLNNPESFIEKATEIILNNRHTLAIDGIKYIKLNGKEYFAQEIFDTPELIANLDRNAVKVEHSVFDYVVYDSDTIERPFAVALDNDPDVKMFFKIPDRFKIETPIGTYNPDWAVYLTKNGEEKLYFILETKGSTNIDDLRTKEQLKIRCGIKHFKALQSGINMEVAKDWNEFKMKV